jgi:4-amino-4-deoxy-L-arabinose transferase-like glycosyltransferase
VGSNNKLLVASSICLYSICNLTAFPLLLEMIAKRIHTEYLVMGTGLVFFISQGFTALASFVVGLITNSQTKISTLWALSVAVIVALIGFALSVFAEWHSAKPFDPKVISSSAEPKKKGTINVRTEVTNEYIDPKEK